MGELDPAAAATLAKLVDTLTQIRHLTTDAEDYKTALRDRLGPGAHTINGQPAVAITPTRRFDPDHAAAVLPPHLLAAITRPTIDSRLARNTLPPALYTACQTDTGKPTVKPA